MEDKKLTKLTNYSKSGNRKAHDNQVSKYKEELTALLPDNGLMVTESPEGEMPIAEKGTFTQQFTVGRPSSEKICVLYFNINGSISVSRRSYAVDGKRDTVFIHKNTGRPYDMLKKCKNWCLPI